MMHLILTALREARLNIRGKLASFLVTILMVSLSFMVFDIFIAVSWNLEAALREEQQNVGIEVFLQDGVTETQSIALADIISGMEGVRSVYRVSSEEAEAFFRADLPEQADLLTLMGPDFALPASIQISLHPEYRSSERVQPIARTLSGMAGVEDVVYGEEYLPGLTRAVAVLSRLVLLAGLVLAVSISLVVANTVRLAVAEKSLTVEIMSIVGAPAWFVRLPFLGEGIVTGLSGSAGSLLLTGLVSGLLSSTVSHGFLPGRWIAGVLLLGAATGALGSWIGMRSGLPRPRS
jgi:cell division transport system permease protein